MSTSTRTMDLRERENYEADAGGAAVSEAKPRWLIALALEIPREVWRAVEEHYKQDIAAAEERGRLGGQFSPLGDNHHNAAACPYCGDLLTKAEDRGRRRGVEEAAKEVESITHEGVVSELIAYAAKRVRALAPRDSGPVCACPLRIAFPDYHLATCALRAPRDSGKEGRCEP